MGNVAGLAAPLTAGHYETHRGHTMPTPTPETTLCQRQPDWWTTGDDGNRLARTICLTACPRRTACRRKPGKASRIRAGVAHDTTGQPLPTCPCGRPILTLGAAACPQCDPRGRLPLPACRAQPGHLWCAQCSPPRHRVDHIDPHAMTELLP